ncbi:hypothetical protein ACFX2F_027865 [Malus domestica]
MKSRRDIKTLKIEIDFSKNSDEIPLNLGSIIDMGRLQVVENMNQRFKAVAAGHAMVGGHQEGCRDFGFGAWLRGFFSLGTRIVACSLLAWRPHLQDGGHGF